MAGPSKSFRLGEDATAGAPALAGRNGRTGRTRRTGSADRLSTDRIVEVAIQQLREYGYDAVTMRSIARELGTGPASLYAHVANRAELDQLVVGRVCSQWRLPDPDPERWDQQLRASMIDLLALYRANPGVARCTLGMIPVEPGLMVVSERFLALLRAGRVPDQAAAWFLDVGSLYVASVAVEEDIWRERAAQGSPRISEEAAIEQVRAVFERLPAEQFPLLASLAATMTTGSAEDRFAFGVDLLVSGLKALRDGR